jgi:prepilin-type N-terminal cleavage/methylation domain-containing protein
MNPEKRSKQMKTFLNRADKEDGFTLIELVLVLLMIGILASIATNKMIVAAERAEITAEDRTIDVLRSNLINNFGNDLLEGVAAKFPDDPFVNLSKVPTRYDRRRSFQPTGEDEDAEVWVFVGGGGGAITPEEAGTTLLDFTSVGDIYHQRKDGTIVKWPYDSSNGIIGKKTVQASSAKEEADADKQRRGVPTEKELLKKTR